MMIRNQTFDTCPAVNGPQIFAYRSTKLSNIGISQVEFLREGALEFADVGAKCVVFLALAGSFSMRHSGTDLVVDGTAAAVHRPGGGPTRIRWPARSRALYIRFDLSCVFGALGRVLGEEGVPDFIDFDYAMNTADGYGREWAGFLLSLYQHVGQPDSVLDHPRVAAPLAESLLNGFLLAAKHSSSEALASSATSDMPTSVRRARDLIEADPRAPFNISSLAARCGVTPRVLQLGFRRYVGISPMAYLRQVRLRNAHEELRDGNPFRDSVSAIAQRWGFNHLGRFAARHEARYGQTPLKTLQSKE